MTERPTSRLPLFVLALVLALVFYRLFLGETFFWGLPSLQFYPWRDYAFDLLRSGHLPLWNPYNGAGAPLLANYQSALLYPLNWPGYILPLAWSMSLTAVLHLFIAGWGMWACTGRLGLSSLGRGVSALAFGLTSYLVARLGTYPTVSAAAWLPWELWATLGVLTHFRRRNVAWLALFTGLQLLAGHAQTTWYSLLLVAIFTAYWSVAHRPHWQRPALVIGGLALGAGLAAAQLLPTAELLLQSQRSGGVADYDFAMNYSYGLARTLNLLSPNVFGTPADGSYVTKGAFFEDAVYIGLIPLVSALVAVIAWAWGKLRKAERSAYFASVPFWLVIVVIAYILALGKNSPVFPFLYQNVPTFSLFQGPARWHLWTVFALSVLAGIGVGAWGNGYWLFFGTRLAAAGCVGAVLLALAAPNFLPPDVAANDGVQAIIRAVVATGVVGALAGLLTLTQPENHAAPRYGLWSLAVFAVMAADLGYAAWGLNPTAPSAFYDRRPSTRDTRAYWPKQAEDAVQFDTYLPFDDYQVAVQKLDAYRVSGLPNLNLVDRTPLLNNFEPLLVGPFAQYIDLIEKNPAQRDKLLQAAGTAALYDESGQLRPLTPAGQRAWFVSEICQEVILPGANVLNPDWNPQTRVYTLPVHDPGPCPTKITGALGQVLSWQDNSDSLTIQVDAPDGGLLVLADTDYSGWTATVDGQPADIQRANINFRAVLLPAGAKAVEFSYRPWWLWPGALISIMSFIGLLVLFRSKNPNDTVS